MMADNFYALLIGIDRYEPNQYYRDLRGCVADINLGKCNLYFN
jgi:hypothetical protein